MNIISQEELQSNFPELVGLSQDSSGEKTYEKGILEDSLNKNKSCNNSKGLVIATLERGVGGEFTTPLNESGESPLYFTNVEELNFNVNVNSDTYGFFIGQGLLHLSDNEVKKGADFPRKLETEQFGYYSGFDKDYVYNNTSLIGIDNLNNSCAKMIWNDVIKTSLSMSGGPLGNQIVNFPILHYCGGLGRLDGKAIYTSDSRYDISRPLYSNEEIQIFVKHGEVPNETPDNWFVVYIDQGIGAGLSDTNVYQYTELSSYMMRLKYESEAQEEENAKSNTTPLYVLTQYIHFLFPNGKQCYTRLDRTGTYVRNNFPELGLKYWFYEDFNDAPIDDKTYVFADWWNAIINGEYVQYGLTVGNYSSLSELHKRTKPTRNGDDYNFASYSRPGMSNRGRIGQYENKTRSFMKYWNSGLPKERTYAGTEAINLNDVKNLLRDSSWNPEDYVSWHGGLR